MERLTKRCNGVVTYIGASNEYETGQIACEVSPQGVRELLNRVAAYEDTELTPDQCANAKAIVEAAFSDDTSKAERIRELLKADRDGRVVVLPCKVGDTVYFALLGRIIEKQIFSIVSFSSSTRIYCDGTSEYFRPEDIGKTSFLTREEAEKALEAKRDVCP